MQSNFYLFLFSSLFFILVFHLHTVVMLSAGLGGAVSCWRLYQAICRAQCAHLMCASTCKMAFEHGYTHWSAVIALFLGNAGMSISYVWKDAAFKNNMAGTWTEHLDTPSRLRWMGGHMSAWVKAVWSLFFSWGNGRKKEKSGKYHHSLVQYSTLHLTSYQIWHVDFTKWETEATKENRI